MILLSDVTRDYLAFLAHEQGAAKSTVYCYASWLHHFQRWLQAQSDPNPSLSAFTTETLRRFSYYLSTERKHRPRTLRGAFYPLKGLAKFCLANGLLTENPLASIVLPKKDAALRQTITTEDVLKLLDGCERQRNQKQIALSRCAFSLLIYSGLRRTELLDLNVGDIDFAEGSVLVRSGKGSKSRSVYVPKVCLDAVRDWLTFRPADCSHTFLLCIDRARRMQGRGLDTLFREVKNAAGLSGANHITPHVLRHWRATDLLASGADLKSIQSFLGHASLQVTSIYLHSDEQRCRALADVSRLLPKEPEQGKLERRTETQRIRRSLR